ncbi:helix-turn-helix transcriptional regulator [Curvibacter sp. CHRR-16]|uniref:helix-turn-helix transcriptional regulator n=1 Tax=Curvibacter sp. CHRR-16 TaxID=2835872 RepID=UPI001BDAF282|nr:AraC family transcriptional regulator [Curvibacter sp. CHRR-16]MBT0570231.1 helix-turn-helix transcriptional regulator [Curvibacter sp. CHRR-16]
MTSVSEAIDGTRLRNQVGKHLQLVGPSTHNTNPLLQGSFTMAKLRPGLSLHCTDVMHLRDICSHMLVEQPCIKVLLRLEGNAQVEIGCRNLPLNAGLGTRAAPLAAMVSICEPETLKRYSQAGTRQRMVVLTLRSDWLEEAGFTESPLQEHLCIQSWRPSRRAIALAEQLIHPLGPSGPLQRLIQESRALELVSEAFTHLSSQNTDACMLTASETHRIRRLQELLDSGEADLLDMSGIAKQVGCNVSTLQQQFRAVYGMTIFDYLREQRLQRAAHALQHDGISVAQAADIAGYSSQANFSTAFRRRYGVSPKHYRNQL